MENKCKIPEGYVEVDTSKYINKDKITLSASHIEYYQFFFRGLRCEVEKLVTYLNENNISDYEERFVSDEITEIKVFSLDKTPHLIETFPTLKGAGLRENWFCSNVEVVYSESGFAELTECVNTQCTFDGEQDDDDARWCVYHEITENKNICFLHLGTGIHVNNSYSFPYSLKKRWEADNYICEINHIFYGKEISDDNLFEIEDNVLISYNGFGGSVVIPDTVKEILQYAFDSTRDKIESLYIPASVTEYRNAFCKMSILKKVIIEEGATRICPNAFSDCENLIDVILPDSLQEISYSAFANCKNLDVSNLKIPNSLIVFDKSSIRGTLNQPSIMINHDSGALLFYSDENKAKEYIVPAGIRYIGDSAFDCCENLSMIQFPDTIEEIGSFAFYSSGISEICFPPKVQVIESRVCSYCKKLEHIILPKNLKKIGRAAFEYSSLKSLTIPDGVEEIDEYAFCNCKLLEEVDLPNSVNKINSEAFSSCNLKEFCIPSKVTKVSDNMLSDNRKLKKVYTHENITEIGNKAFADCNELNYIDIPDSITTIGTEAFAGCKKASLRIPNKLKKCGAGAFSDCAEIRSVNIPGTLKEVSSKMFKNCVGLETVTIEDGVKKIGNSAFVGCENLKAVYIEGNLEKGYGKKIFEKCKNVCVYGIPGTAAEKCAADNNVPFYSISEKR